MLKISLFELFFRAIPEAFIFVLASCGYSKTNIDISKFIKSSCLLGLLVYAIRKLPVHFGVHTILIMIVNVLIVVLVIKIEIIQAISSILISSIILYLCEGMNVILLKKLMNVNLDVMFTNQVMKIIYGLPSLFMFGIIIIFYYRYISKKRRVNKC